MRLLFSFFYNFSLSLFCAFFCIFCFIFCISLNFVACVTCVCVSKVYRPLSVRNEFQNCMFSKRRKKEEKKTLTSIFVYYTHELNRVELTLVKSNTQRNEWMWKRRIETERQRWILNGKSKKKNAKINEYIIIIGID